MLYQQTMDQRDGLIRRSIDNLRRMRGAIFSGRENLDIGQTFEDAETLAFATSTFTLASLYKKIGKTQVQLLERLDQYDKMYRDYPMLSSHNRSLGSVAQGFLSFCREIGLISTNDSQHRPLI